MAIESWALDGLTLTSGTFTLMDLNVDPPRARRDWVTAADSESAALFRQPLHENRTITMKLRVTAQASMDTALDKVGALVDKFRSASATPAGVSLVWTPGGSARTCTFTVLAGEVTGLPISLSGDGYSWVLSRPIITVEMVCQPYWVGAEVLTSTASASAPIVTLEVTNTGDVPGRGRVIVTDTATQARRYVGWGLEGPSTYNAATSLLLDSDSLVTSGFAGTQTTRTGANDPNASGNSTITASLTSSAVGVCGTGNQSHVGYFRVLARVQTTGTSSYVRLAWAAGDNPLASNAYVAPRSASVWQEVDLGVITVPAVTAGTQRWSGIVQAYDDTSATVYVDYLILVPAGDGHGVARSAYQYNPGVTVGRDEFTSTTAGNALNARVAPAGGTWATSGDATDYVFWDNFVVSPADTLEAIRRTTTAAEASGRFAILGSTNYADVEVSVRARVTGGEGVAQGLVARWTDSSNHLRLIVPTGSTAGVVRLEMVVAGVVTVLGSSTLTRAATLFDPYRLRLIAFSGGKAIAHVLTDAGAIAAEITAVSSVLATAGTLATGKIGLHDRNVAGFAGSDRSFTAFAVATPFAESVAINSGRTLQFRHDDTVRDDSTGTYYGRPNSYMGSRALIPVGTSRVVVYARRNDIETSADDQVTDATQIQIGYTPRGLVVPR